MGPACITSWYPQFNGSHFSLPSTKWLAGWQFHVNYDECMQAPFTACLWIFHAYHQATWQVWECQITKKKMIKIIMHAGSLSKIISVWAWEKERSLSLANLFEQKSKKVTQLNFKNANDLWNKCAFFKIHLKSLCERPSFWNLAASFAQIWPVSHSECVEACSATCSKRGTSRCWCLRNVHCRSAMDILHNALHCIVSWPCTQEFRQVGSKPSAPPCDWNPESATALRDPAKIEPEIFATAPWDLAKIEPEIFAKSFTAILDEKQWHQVTSR